ncbi:NADH-ubiquinone oxidoreductase 75 kDa subunit, mitochondrial-like [Aricia agestis]|uniref:NADH-ubiquinone oxidoreductase 75 kDa subunit, mitochondrial-like n=1 Tax=Aricia agestis TaxID=91739 RepID=UPI001C207AF3|nr:NADH-ubiquinone oxidoreductase 75 kDa subunit, mitochondrial-like [Aricia agestis]
MCLVEIEGWIKPQIACSTPVADKMKIRTNSDMTLKAQEGVLEFILIDHPLDCPICDQGGECDLQDLTMRFGSDRTRFTDIHFKGKRAVESCDLGPLIRTEMTRCIHCTRCIRFASQMCGVEVLGSTGRGGDMLIGTYVDKSFLSELSGNVIDLCPVGALTSKPYMFKARPWEVKRTGSIDVTDATGTNIILNHKSDRVLRVLPRENEEVNQEWLSDKGRWAVDSVEMQRLVTPMYRCGNSLFEADWKVVLRQIGNVLCCTNPTRIMAVAGPHTNVETLVATKDLLNALGCEHTYVERDFSYSLADVDIRAGFCLNNKMKNTAEADKILLVGTNPRFEAPILNAWIRQAYLQNECDVYVVGPNCDYNYPVNYLGEDLEALSCAQQYIQGSKHPLIFVGVDQLGTSYASQIMHQVMTLTSSLQVEEDWQVINIVTKEASFAGALECGWKPGALKALESINPVVVISLGADEIFHTWDPGYHVKIIYIGFQGDKCSDLASFVLPGSAYTEAGGIFLNMEGRSQLAQRAVTPPGKARHDWKIVRAIAEYTGVDLKYSDETELWRRLAEISPNLLNVDKYQPKLFTDLLLPLIPCEKLESCAPGSLKVEMKTLRDYYCSDIFSSNSPTMVKAYKAAKQLERSAFARI